MQKRKHPPCPSLHPQGGRAVVPRTEHWWLSDASGNAEMGTARGAGEPSGRDRSCNPQPNQLDQLGQFPLVLAALTDGLIKIKQMSENSLASERCV